MRTQIVEGLRWLWRHRLLRTLALALGLMNGVGAATMATFVLFGQEILALDGLGFGLLLAAGGVGGLLGSALSPNLVTRLGAGRSLLLAILAPLATFGAIAATSSAVVAGIAFGAFGFVVTAWNVVTVSLRQTLIPDVLLGRVNSAYRFFGWGAMPLGTVLGGGLVNLVEVTLGRDLALRSPFIAAVTLHLLLLVTVAPKLTQRAIDQARDAAPDPT